MTQTSKRLRILAVINVIVLVLNAVWFWQNSTRPAGEGGQSAQYPLLAKRIFVENPNEIFINFVPLRKKLEARLNQIDAPKSFYFEYLPDGTSIRLGEDTELVAASLIKLPLVMNLYRAAELGRIDLNKTVTIAADDLDDGFGELWRKGAGSTLSLKQAAGLALQQSDNTAMRVIYKEVVGKDLLQQDEESLSQLDIEYSLQDGRAVISAKAYASITKCLYFSCYLNWQHSQELLTYLSQTPFNERIASPIPKGVQVAHKIGVFSDKLAESDCGIVYAPKRPYVLCIMVGLPGDQANALMAELSKDIYDFIVSQE
jgi:beta-lactamase class A